MGNGQGNRQAPGPGGDTSQLEGGVEGQAVVFLVVRRGGKLAKERPPTRIAQGRPEEIGRIQSEIQVTGIARVPDGLPQAKLVHPDRALEGNRAGIPYPQR